VGPGSAGVGAVSLGGDRVVAECLGDDWGGGLQDELAKRGGAGGLVGDPERACGRAGCRGASAGRRGGSRRPSVERRDRETTVAGESRAVAGSSSRY